MPRYLAPDPGFARVATALLAIFLCAAASLTPDPSIQCSDCRDWNEPQAPFRIFGNTWYVGTAGLSSILIDTGSGLILLDGGLPQSAPLIDANLRGLGFSIDEVRYIALSHAHFDHAGGIAALQRASGARVLSSTAGAEALRRGALLPTDPQFGFGPERTDFPAVANVTAIEDGETILLGDVTLRGIHTPGHTPGGMSWTWRSCEGGRCLDMVYADSLSPVSAPGFRFSGGAAKAIRTSADRIAGLDCDIMLAPHPFLFDLQARAERGEEAFIDDQACRRYAEDSLARLERRLRTE